METKEKSSFYIWKEMAAYTGISFATKRHSHFFHQFCFSLDKPFLLRGKNGKNFYSQAALVPSGVSHETSFGNERFIILLIDPLLFAVSYKVVFNPQECDPAFDLKDVISNSDILFFEKELKSNQIESKNKIIQLLKDKFILKDQRNIDNRIRDSLSIIQQDELDQLTLNQISKITKLSPSRFRHLFRTETGITFSSYKLWKKTQKAILVLIEQKDLMNAAYEGGFFDQPHFNRVLRRSFGLSPSELKKNTHFELKIFS
ncbi:helix-turn-helix domain-containing protein [Leptospira bandrabouensis]|uniref:AraC family transcriptional regulator n=1 Tax=Leptospira bandrabouensis TaxID=2484903 RepID=A0A6H3NWT9_9LEPT|nr:AraC family transcriptional regulator [Leptospira bandrabouensis]MCG6143410.1 AraC family transcriptional regulator [Leptospira bandrabouensis]MCG6151548.1 AraC family transcriptional regulator [Leptospira bandrabouensis]MCG6159070.1 AraC family transcriptional regulator [Leptospira bandrabouensis]MCG6163004.1 AraC family transcriptional regulator [Leptospira bandrabouensis]MCW7458145.1 AraC family transcriptional regulator [Leptospira bandrabouensis]